MPNGIASAYHFPQLSPRLFLFILPSLEARKRRPRGVLRFDPRLYVAWQVHEEVEPGPRLHLVYAHSVVRVAIRVSLVLEPEGHADGIGHGSAGTRLHPKHQLVEVVRDRDPLGWIFRRTRVAYSAALALLIEGYARHHIDLLIPIFRYALHCPFQIAPDTAIEAVLNLRNLVRHVEGLGLHLGISVTRAVRTHMSSRIGFVRVAASRHLYLVLLIDVRIVSPRRKTLVRAHMSALERIGRPERCHHRGVVEDGVVPLGLCVGGACHILRAVLTRGEFEPILIHRRPCRPLGLEDHRRTSVEGPLLRRVLSRTQYGGVCLEDIARSRSEAR